MAADEQLHNAASKGDDDFRIVTDLLNLSVSKHKIDEHFTLVWANPYFYKFIGFPKDEYEALFRNLPDLYYASNPEDLAVITEHVLYALEHDTGGYECVTRLAHKSGKLMWVKFSATFLDEYVDGYQLSYTVMTDVTELMEAQVELEAQKLALEEANADLERLAFVDSVTEGYSQTRFNIEAARRIACAGAGAFQLVSLDMKKFKLLNDIQGIEMGNEVLRHVHAMLKKHLRAGELLARISADTFNLLLEAADEAKTIERLTGMVADINRFNEGRTHPYYLTMSIGVYRIDDPALPITSIRDRSNVARNASKAIATAQHFTYVFYNEIDRQKLLREKDMENRMHLALEDDEFVVYLQPKQRLEDGEIGGAEALVRWIHPVRGLVPPDEFVPFFERNGFIIEVDLYVFDRVCAMLRRWLDEGRPVVPISVNMSRAHLHDDDFLEPYDRIRAQHNVPAELLEIELTETMVFANPELLIGVIDDIHRHGYRCSLDDFGSGYSSLNALKDIDVDVLKLDRAFFSDENADNEREWNVISSVIDLAKKLELETVAEGIESAKQSAMLKEMACDMLQGYVFSRPIPIEEFEALLGSVKEE